MASLATHKAGRKKGSFFILFTLNKKRQMIYLGKIKKPKAEVIFDHVENLIAAAVQNTAVKQATAAWLTDADDKLHGKLAQTGLVEARAAQQIVGLNDFIASYLATLNVKAGTRFNLNMARRQLTEFFGADKRLREITRGDADDFRRWLQRPEKDGGKGLSINTVRRYCGRAKQFFRAAVRKRLIAESPFGDMKDCKVSGNDKRFYFVTKDDADKVLAACPGTQWKLLFALARFGGLRCPSEHAWLRWDEVKKDTITVHSPKTEHHEGRESRDVPIFSELRPYLDAARAEAQPAEEYVITIPSVAEFRRGGASPNLGTRMRKIVKRAGLTPWPKLFQNLRATRQKELTDRGEPEYAVCSWLGNSQAVAREHYLPVTDQDFAKAAAEDNGGEAEEEARQCQNGKRKGNQPGAAASCLLLQSVKKALEIDGLEQVVATLGKALQEYEMTPRGIEPLLPP